MLGHNGFFVVSAEFKNKLSSSNIRNTKELKNSLVVNQIPHREVLGGYKYEDDRKHTIENSFVIPSKYENFVLETMNQYGQESILYVNPMGKASLIYSCGKLESIGKWSKVDTIKGLIGFTHCPSTETFWSIK